MTSDEPLGVLVVDDHEVVRRGFVRLLESEPGFEVVGEAGDGTTAVKLALQRAPDVVLTDIRMRWRSSASGTGSKPWSSPTSSAS